MPDDDDRPRDASSAAGAGWSDPDRLNTAWFEVSAPDDISELARDVQAYRRELRAARRRAWFDKVFSYRGARPLTLTLSVLALAAIVVSLLTVLRPTNAAKGPTDLPLASTSIAAGQTGGLLPAVDLRRATDHTTVASQSLRPGVLALLPAHCSCTPLLTGLAESLSPTQVGFYVIAPSDPDAEAAALTGPLRSDSVFYDPNGDLAASFSAHGLTLVTVNRDGTVVDIRRDVVSPPGGDLAVLVHRMLQSGASG